MNWISIALVFFILISSCSEKECEDFIRDKYTNQEFSGIVREAYFQVSDGGRGTPTLIIESESKYYIGTYRLVCFANYGDSIIKKGGTLRYLLKQKDTTLVFYPECKRKLILDSGRTDINPYSDIQCGREK